MPKIFGFFLSFALFLITAKSALAAITVKISDYPSTITQEPFTITVSVEGAQTATNYLRVDLFKEDTSSYFGETYNGAEWYSGSDGKQYFPISVQSGQIWSGEFQARIGEPSLSKYTGSGAYKMRIRRYTASGGQGGENARDSSVSITISAPVQDPTPTPQSSTTQSTSSTSGKSKSPSPTPKNSPPPVSSKKASSVLGSSQSAEIIASSAAGISLSVSPIPSTEPQVDKSSNKIKIAGAVAGSGAIVMGLSAGLYLWYKRKLTSGNKDKGST